MKKKNDFKSSFVSPLIGILTIVLVVGLFFLYFKVVYSKYNTTIDKYDESLKEIGYVKKSNTFYYGDDLRLTINQHDSRLSIEIRDRLQDYDWKKNLDVYLKSVNLFADFDNELCSKGIEYVINNGIESENYASVSFSLSSFSISIYYYPKENLYINITYDKYTTSEYKHYYADGIVDQSFEYDKLVLEKIFSKDVPVELLKKISDNALQSIDNTIINNNFEYDSIFGSIASYNKSLLNISYSKYEGRYNYIQLELVYKIDDYRKGILKDLEYLDRLFNVDSVKYKDKIINLIEDPNTKYNVSEKTNYSEKYYYGTFNLDDYFKVHISLYENRVIINYQFKE